MRDMLLVVEWVGMDGEDLVVKRDGVGWVEFV